jgi:DNA-binding response OmpR family regulator
MEAVWDANWFGPTKTLDVHVAALRRKLAGAITIEAVRGGSGSSCRIMSRARPSR